jgi:putative ABC transport system permease protein
VQAWLWPLLRREWQHHPWRHLVALLAVALGVALAWSVHLINRSALAEFSAAVRSANGEPDLTLRALQPAGLDDALFERVATDPAVERASPVLEIDTYGRPAQHAGRGRVALRVLGIDALRVAAVAPALLPRATAGEDRLAFLDPQAAYANPAALESLGLGEPQPGDTLALQAGPAWQTLRLAGSVPAGGTPLVVLDIAAAQERFGLLGRLSRIDLRLVPGSDQAALLARLQLPAGVQAMAADDAEQRVSLLSRAYRVNLTVLALVALFVGAFLVFSVVALSVAQRTPAFALLGVLGMTARERQRLVLAECAALGVAGSLLGLLLGTGMAWGALNFLAGDLGGGYFPGIRPQLQWHSGAALVFAALGTASALLGGWWPARQAQAIVPAQAIKGLGQLDTRAAPAWPGLLLLAAGTAAAFVPPIAGLPLAAYLGVAMLLLGGVALVPAVVNALLAGVPAPRGALPLLAVQRARFQRRTASAAVAGVVASLALSVALTVMVASFRTGVSQWLDSVLPAELYARSAGSSAAGAQAWLPPEFASQAAATAGVLRVQASRSLPLQLAPGRPAVTLVARPLGAGSPADVGAALPLLEAALPRSLLQPGEVAVYVSEAMVSLYGAQPGSLLTLPLGAVPTPASGQTAGAAAPGVPARVLGVWRDYARQFGAVVMADQDYRRLTGDTRINDLALWLQPGTPLGPVQDALRALLPDPAMLEFAASGELRTLSLRIFDRSFAVTYYLQAVAVGIGLVGIAASLSAQVLARRKEFGLLAHLGLTRRQVLAVVAGEAAAWVAAGVAVGLALGLAISLVLVHVVNPQSFHWTMPLVLPAGRLALLCAAVWVAGVATAAFSARHAAGRQAVLSVKEDW